MSKEEFVRVTERVLGWDVATTAARLHMKTRQVIAYRNGEHSIPEVRVALLMTYVQQAETAKV